MYCDTCNSNFTSSYDELKQEEFALLQIIDIDEIEDSIERIVEGISMGYFCGDETSLSNCFELGITVQEIFIDVFNNAKFDKFSIEQIFTLILSFDSQPSRTQKTILLVNAAKEYICSYVFKEFLEDVSFDKYFLKSDLRKRFYESALKIYRESYDKKRG